MRSGRFGVRPKRTRGAVGQPAATLLGSAASGGQGGGNFFPTTERRGRFPDGGVGRGPGGYGVESGRGLRGHRPW